MFVGLQKNVVDPALVQREFENAEEQESWDRDPSSLSLLFSQLPSSSQSRTFPVVNLIAMQKFSISASS